MNIDVIYFVESVPKELDVACIVSLLLERKFGLRVKIASFKAPASERLLRNRPRLLVVPTCYAADAWGVNKHIGRWPDVPFLNLTWEELFPKAALTWKNPRDGFVRQHLLHHVWGNFYKEFLVSHGVAQENIIVNGHPGYQLYESPYKHCFPTRAELAERHQLDPRKRWIFFPENYGYAFYSDANMTARVEGGMDPEVPHVMRDFCRSSLKIVLDWCDACGQRDGVEMIVRPRPSTHASHFVRLSEELVGRPLSHVRFIKDRSVLPWILASDVVVSSYSTSLIEGAIVGKPIYMVEPIPLLDSMWSPWQDEVGRLTTRDAFLEACLDRPPAGDHPLRAWASRNLRPQGDPILNLVDIIGKICDGRIHAPSPPQIPPPIHRPRRSLLAGVVRDTWHTLHGLVATKESTGDRDAHIFDRREVSASMERWRRLLQATALLRDAGFPSGKREGRRRPGSR